MEPVCLNILNEWAKYIDYDKNKTNFNLLNWDWETHKVTQSLTHITEDYDESGLLAVLCAKRLFFKMLNTSKISLSEAVSSPKELKKHRKMRDLFEQEEIKQAEEKYFQSVLSLINQAAGKNKIGKIDRAKLREKVFSYTDNVISTIDKCRIEFYQKGEPLHGVSRFSTNIHVFPTLARCVLALSGAPNGMYLCFIDTGHTANGWFGFFVKDGTNLLSINERIDETFKGQHNHSRNGRWTESKADKIFPYDFIFDYDDYDYKGYSHSYVIDDEKLAFFKMEEDAYLPLLIAMGMLAKKLKTIDLSKYEPVFIDSLLDINIAQISEEKTELAIIQKNEIVRHSNSIDLSFDYDKIMDGTSLAEFQPTKEQREKGYRSLVCAKGSGQIFVDLYGKGFQIKPDLLSTHKLIASGDYDCIPEFIGTEKRLRAQAWCEIRKQLTDYIYEQMYLEYKASGGMKGIRKWIKNQIDANIGLIERLASDHYDDVKAGRKQNVTGNWRPAECPGNYYITLIENQKYAPSISYGYPYIVNKTDKETKKICDPYNGTTCNMWFVFRFINWEGIQNLFGDVLKIIKGWDNKPRSTSGNSLLDMTDPVEAINTPFEYYCSNRPEYAKDRTFTSFAFAIGFSKSGFKAMRKKLKEKGEPTSN